MVRLLLGGRMLMGANGHCYPTARSHRLVIEHLEDEVVVYDLDTDEAHLLNPVMAEVWARCDGVTSLDDLCSSVDNALIQDADRKLLVLHALQQLDGVGLLEKIPTPVSAPEISRRQMLKRLGIAAVALPTITSILAPTAAAAVSSGQQIGTTCANSGNCASNCCKSVQGTFQCVSCTQCQKACDTSNQTCTTTVTTNCCNTTSGNCN